MTRNEEIKSLKREINILNEKYDGLYKLLRPAQSIGTPIKIPTNGVYFTNEKQTIYYSTNLLIYDALQALADHLGIEWKYEEKKEIPGKLILKKKK